MMSMVGNRPSWNLFQVPMLGCKPSIRGGGIRIARGQCLNRLLWFQSKKIVSWKLSKRQNLKTFNTVEMALDLTNSGTLGAWLCPLHKPCQARTKASEEPSTWNESLLNITTYCNLDTCQLYDSYWINLLFHAISMHIICLLYASWCELDGNEQPHKTAVLLPNIPQLSSALGVFENLRSQALNSQSVMHGDVAGLLRVYGAWLHFEISALLSRPE